MTRFLVTGGAGFIGSHIVTELVKRGEEVIVIDNFLTGKKENLENVKREIVLIEGDIRDITLLQKALLDVDVVLHQAALPSVPRSMQDPLTANEINILGTLNVLLAARDNKVKRVVYASSSSIYGDTPQQGASISKHEKLQPNPLSPYAVGKLIGELYCRQFYELYGLETVSLRYFNVFGQRQDPHSEYAAVIPKFIHAMLHNQQPVIFGDGTQTRDFTFVQNVVEANILASTAKQVAGHTFNIACGEGISLRVLATQLNAILEKQLDPRYAKPRPGDVQHSQADISEARKKLGYEPLVHFEQGLKDTVRWFRARA